MGARTAAGGYFLRNRRLSKLPVEVRAAVLAALQHRPGTLYSLLVATSRNGPPHDQKLALSALGILRYVRATGLLEANIQAYEDLVRDGRKPPEFSIAREIALRSCDALHWMDTPRSHGILQGLCLHSPDEGLRACALEMLGGEAEQYDADFIYRFLGPGHPEEMVVGALWGLLAHKRAAERDSDDEVKPLLSSGSPNIRAAAIEVIAWSDSSEDLTFLRPFLADDSFASMYKATVGSITRQSLAKLEAMADASERETKRQARRSQRKGVRTQEARRPRAGQDPLS